MMNQQEKTPPPPADLSLKYMAWDHKKLVEAVVAVQAELRMLNNNLQSISNAIMGKKHSVQQGKSSSSGLSDDIPF